jgi:hypothetical protein
MRCGQGTGKSKEIGQTLVLWAAEQGCKGQGRAAASRLRLCGKACWQRTLAKEAASSQEAASKQPEDKHLSPQLCLSMSHTDQVHPEAEGWGSQRSRPHGWAGGEYDSQTISASLSSRTYVGWMRRQIFKNTQQCNSRWKTSGSTGIEAFDFRRRPGKQLSTPSILSFGDLPSCFLPCTWPGDISEQWCVFLHGGVTRQYTLFPGHCPHSLPWGHSASDKKCFLL